MAALPDKISAINDFNEARRKAALRDIFARLTGESTELLSYEDVRQKLRAVAGNAPHLEDIPLDAIIGSVGRYSDFTRDFLPRFDSTQTRWVGIMTQATGSRGLPPIDVYQIGEAYFVKDGNHRVSVARQLENTHIQAYVTAVRSRVPLEPNISPDDLIVKTELANFLEATRIDVLRPEANLFVTIPGRYPIIEEHISVHRYFMGIDQDQEISFENAVTHWYDKVYLPVIQIIRERGILQHFPDRTETDLYLWIAKRRFELENSLGWQIETQDVAADLVSKYAPAFQTIVTRITNRFIDIITPDPLESGPPVGYWRREHKQSALPPVLFENILVAVSEDPAKWQPLDQAIFLAQKENGNLRGLHVVQDNPELQNAQIQDIQTKFSSKCAQKNVNGELAIEVGTIARKICERNSWADLVVLNLAHPPGNSPVERLNSGVRTIIRRCSRPLLAVPGNVTNLQRVLLAYNNSPKAQEALYIAAYLSQAWNAQLTVLILEESGQDTEEIQTTAQNYLENQNISAEYCLRESDDRPKTILNAALEFQCDLILMGGYKAAPLVEIVLGSVVDEILRGTKIPVLICR
jgi:nucleotide-binding universal stress UspA family protein